MPPTSVSTLAMVTTLVLPLNSVSLSNPPLRSITPAGNIGADGDHIGTGAADDRLDIGQEEGIADTGERNLVVAIAEVDRAGGQGRRQFDQIVSGTAGDGFDIGQGDGIGETRQSDAVGTRPEIEDGAGYSVAQDHLIAYPSNRSASRY